ncbi:hypothetical protein HA466_0000960 [Hirschfeldia incana]|nr:hypothetical protein HA466_0000960 [Hirschfeldia incana]
MEKFSYNSYPDSAESSPRSRDVDFDNPPPWEDQQQTQQTNSYKVKFMCSYGGKIQPRPHDNQLTYVNGDTKILSVDRGIRFPALASKLSAVIGGGGDGEISFKYQLPGEDLDALISVTNEDDLEHMMHEYDRLLRMSSKPARMRLFLFPLSSSSVGGFGSEGSTKSDRETMSTIANRPESEKSVTAPASNNADFLFGSEKVVGTPPAPPSPPRQIQDPQMFVNRQVITPDPGEIQRQINEFQRIQIRDQEQQHQQMLIQQQQQLQQEAMYRRKSEDGRYFTPTYAQNPPQPPPTTTVSQTNQQQQPPVGYWQGNTNSNIPGNNIYATTTSQNVPEQQVYMIPAQSQAPGTIYHSVMRPPPTQGNQGYYPPVQRVQQHHPDPYMEQQNNQQGYNVVQPPQPTYSGGPQVMSSGPMGIHETQPYSQMGNPVYYTVAGDGMMVPPQPHQAQYQGMGQPVSGMTGPDGKVVVNPAPKVSQSSDSV